MAVHPEIQKVFYVFPYTTLITQTNQTLKNALGLTSTELAELHSKAGFNEKTEEREDGLYADKKQDYIDRLFALFPVCVMSHVKFFDMLKTNRKEANYLAKPLPIISRDCNKAKKLTVALLARSRSLAEAFIVIAQSFAAT